MNKKYEATVSATTEWLVTVNAEDEASARERLVEGDWDETKDMTFLTPADILTLDEQKKTD
jgi:hypothetical protein